MTQGERLVQGYCPDRRPILTGSGLKDPEASMTLHQKLHELPADLGAI